MFKASNRITLLALRGLEDVEIIKKFYYDIFPEEPHYDLADFKNSVTGNHKYSCLQYYYAFDNEGELVGFCGIYADYKYRGEVWLGWFGIKPRYRGKGFGTEMLKLLEEFVSKIGFHTVRVYTDKKLNNNAYKMYLKNGYIEDSTYEYDFVTMYKSLKGDKVEKWQGVPLGFESEPPHHFS